MPAFPRSEMEEMMRRWLKANEDAEAAGDWRGLADYYTEDAEYTWNLGPNEDFVARGRQQIRDWVMGTEMEGLDGWEYPYDAVLIDEQRGEVVAFWRQVAPATRADGTHYEIKGMGGSWFRYARRLPLVVAARLLRLRQRDGVLHGADPGRQARAPAMQKRIERVMAGEVMPGHVKHAG